MGKIILYVFFLFGFFLSLMGVAHISEVIFEPSERISFQFLEVFIGVLVVITGVLIAGCAGSVLNKLTFVPVEKTTVPMSVAKMLADSLEECHCPEPSVIGDRRRRALRKWDEFMTFGSSYYECDYCNRRACHEAEVTCWKCGKGEMIYKEADTA